MDFGLAIQNYAAQPLTHQVLLSILRITKDPTIRLMNC